MNNRDEFDGNILLFYSYDIGNDIDLEKIRKSKLLNERLITLSPYFKNYNIPYSFELNKRRGVDHSDCIISKVYRFGVISFCYQVPFKDTLDGLKPKIIDIYNSFKKKSDINAKLVYDQIFSAVKSPAFYQLKNSYYVINVIPPKEKMTAGTFRSKYSEMIASLLRLEVARMSTYQKEAIFEATTGYSDEDFVTIDSEAAFSYNDEYMELIEFFELATIKQLQLQYYDMLLDNKLEKFYLQPYKVPLKAYIPLLSSKFELPAKQLSRLRVDISVITERLESSVNLAGDAYFSQVYNLLEKQLSLKEWKHAIDNKLDIIRDLYTVHHHRLETIHAEMLEVTIVVLIAAEIILALYK